MSNSSINVQTESHTSRIITGQNIRLVAYCVYILAIFFVYGSYLNVLTDKYGENKRLAVNFYVKSLFTLDTWNYDDYHAGWKWYSPWGKNELKPVEFKKSQNKFDPFENKNAYANLSKKYWDKLANTTTLEEQEAVYQQAVRDLATYYQVASYWFRDYALFLAYSILGSIFSFFLVVILVSSNKKIKRIFFNDMNQLKQITKWLLINMKKIVRKMAFMMFDEQYFKKNVIIGLTLIFLTLILSLVIYILH